MREIRYRPKNIRETLVELKDSAELAVDLAYAAVLFDNTELAEEVVSLAKEVNYLRYHARIALMLAAKTANDAEELVGIFQVVDGTVDITEAAADIARIPLRGFGVPPAFRALPDVHERFVRLTVGDASPLAGHSLADLDLDIDEGVTVIAIRRDGSWVFDVDGGDQLLSGDVVFARGPEEGIAEFHEDATGEEYTPPEFAAVSEDAQRAVETVVELRNIAELATGLSYSAALYDSDALAEQVRDLEQRSDERREELEQWVVNNDDAEATGDQRRGLFHLAVGAERISDAALDIAEVVFRDVELHPVFGQAIRESREVITSVEIAADSELIGRTITEFEHDVESGMNALALRRDGEWRYDPAEATELAANDRLVLRGPNRGVPMVQRLAGEA